MTLILNPHRYAAPATPLPVQLGTTGWWKADAITGKNDGDAMGTYSDSSGFGRNLTVTSAPTYRTNVKNSLPVVRLDGVDDYFSGAALSTFITSTAHTTYAVFAYASVNTDNAAPAFYNNDAVYGDINGAWGLSLRSSTLALSAWGGPGVAANRTIALGTWYISEYRHEAGTIYHSLNGGAEASTVCGNDTLTGGFRMGRTNGASSFMAGDVGEIVTFNTALSSGNRQAMRDYLSAKWAI